MADYLSTPTATNSFLLKLRALPVVEDSISKATDMYESAKAYKTIAVMMRVAENSVRAASRVLPIAALPTPAGGLEALNLWACQGLDKVQAWAPFISKPTEEMVSDLKGKMLKIVAGNKKAESLADALTNHAEYTILLLNDFSGGRMVVNVATVVVDNAHTFVDFHLPPAEGEVKDYDPTSEGLVPKTSALVLKTQRRLNRIAHSLVHPDDSCMDYSTIHITKFLVSSAKSLCSTAMDNPSEFAGKINLILTKQSTRITLYLNDFPNLFRPPSASEMIAYTRGTAERLHILLTQVLISLAYLLKATQKTAMHLQILVEDALKRALTPWNTIQRETEPSSDDSPSGNDIEDD